MKRIRLQAIPNQTASFDLGGLSYEMTIKSTDNHTIADIKIGGDDVIRGIRIMPFRPILPYEYLAANGGNLFLLTETDCCSPNYKQLGITQYLVYLDSDELEALNGVY